MIPMQSQPTPAPADRSAPWQTALLAWSALGGAALLCVPALRSVDPWFGWLPFWLVVAPALDLAVLRRRWLIARLRTRFERWRGGRRAHRRQARRLGTRRARTALRVPCGGAIATFQSVMPRRLRSMRRRNSPMMRR